MRVEVHPSYVLVIPNEGDAPYPLDAESETSLWDDIQHYLVTELNIKCSLVRTTQLYYIESSEWRLYDGYFGIRFTQEVINAGNTLRLEKELL